MTCGVAAKDTSPRWEIAMPFYENRSVHIYYEEVGSGFPLLLIPCGKDRIPLAMRHVRTFLRAHRP